nr:DNA-directed DNA polymerase [Tanacetum cinerariifolium]
MRTRSKSYPDNSNATISRRQNRKRVPNIVEPEIRNIEEVVPMADRTMEELLQAPTEGYGEAIVIPEILAKNFEIKTNLLQLVQTNKFHGFERDNPHTHISNFKRMTSTLKYRDVPNDAIKLMLFSYSLEGALEFELTQIHTFYNGLNKQDQDSLNAAAGGNLLSKTTREALKIIENKSKVPYSRCKSNVSRVNTNSRESSSKTDDRINKLVDQISNLVEIVNKQVITPATVKAVEKSCMIYGGAHAYYDCIATDSNQNLVFVRQRVLTIKYLRQTELATKWHHPVLHSFADALLLMPKFASTIKSLLTNKDKLFELAKVPLNENCSAMILKKLPKKLRGLDKFLIPCDFSRMDVCHALADLGTSINLMPLSVWKKLFLPELTPTRMTIELADRSITRPKGVAEDVFVKVGKLHFPTDFMVVDFEADPWVHLILGRSFLRTGRALIDVYGEEITLRVNDESVTFNLNQTMRYSSTYDDNLVNRIDVIDISCEEYAQDVLDFKYNSKSGNPILVFNPSLSKETKSEFCKEPIVKSSSPTLTPFGERDFLLEEIEDFLKNESILMRIEDSCYDPEGDILYLEKFLNDDPSQLHPMALKQVEETNDLKDDEKEALLKVLKSHKWATAWKIIDIKGIDPRFYTHKILMEEDYNLTIQSQRRVNPKIHEVIKKEVIKLLDAGMIYPISASPWVSLVHCVYKKGGMTVVANENNELILTRLVTSWRVCIDYRKLNDATRKDHFPLPFMDQMLERLAGNEFYCFLDGFSGYFQILIDPQDQEKTTFTCPYGTFAYRRIPFGLCNALGTFQRCMIAIFHDMIEKTMEVIMDDFSVFGDSFSSCLSNLDKILKRCEDTNLVLNWEKCHLMCKEGIVLGHKISKSEIEADRAKVDVIAKLPHPTTVKGVRSFLGHAGFYQRFIKDFFKIAQPMNYLFKKETPFVFSKYCIDTFETLKIKLTKAPILVVPDWNLPFELMYDASDFAIAKALPTNDAQVVVKFLKSLFARFGTPRAIISDRGTHFCNDQFAKVMTKYGVTHRHATAYHPQTSVQVEVSNQDLKRIFERTAVKIMPYVYGKSCHLPIELEHKAYWALKHANFDLKTDGDHRKLQLNELNELHDQAYENSLIYKERTKKLHDSKIKNCIFNETVELSQPDGPNFKVNGHRVKHYFRGDIPSKVVLDLHIIPMDK